MSDETHGFVIDTLELGPMDNFIYILHDRATSKAAVIDPAWDVPAIRAALAARNAELSDILITHSHPDHVNGLDELLSHHPVPVHVSALEADFWPDCPKDAILHNEGDETTLGETTLRWLITPGHTPGSACLLLDKTLIAADTLFIYGCGRCDLPGGDPSQLFASLQRLKNTVDDDIRIYPGHNYGSAPYTDMRAQKDGNPFLHWSNVESFVEYRMRVHDQMRDIPYGPVKAEDLFRAIPDLKP